MAAHDFYEMAKSENATCSVFAHDCEIGMPSAKCDERNATYSTAAHDREIGMPSAIFDERNATCSMAAHDYEMAKSNNATIILDGCTWL